MATTNYFPHNLFIEPNWGPQISHERRFFYPSLSQLSGFYQFSTSSPESYYDDVGNFWMGFNGLPSVSGYPTMFPRVALFTFVPVAVRITSGNTFDVEGDINYENSHYNSMAQNVISICLQRSEDFKRLGVSVCVALERFVGSEPLGFYVWDPLKIAIVSSDIFPPPSQQPSSDDGVPEPPFQCRLGAYRDPITGAIIYIAPAEVFTEVSYECLDGSPESPPIPSPSFAPNETSYTIYHSHNHPWIKVLGLTLPPPSFPSAQPGYPELRHGSSEVTKGGGDFYIGTYVHGNIAVGISYSTFNNPFSLYRSCFNRVYIDKTKSFFVPSYHQQGPEFVEIAERNYRLYYRIDGIQQHFGDPLVPGFIARRHPFIPTYFDFNEHIGHAYLNQPDIPEAMVNDALEFFSSAG